MTLATSMARTCSMALQGTLPGRYIGGRGRETACGWEEGLAEAELEGEATKCTTPAREGSTAGGPTHSPSPRENWTHRAQETRSGMDIFFAPRVSGICTTWFSR